MGFGGTVGERRDLRTSRCQAVTKRWNRQCESRASTEEDGLCASHLRAQRMGAEIKLVSADTDQGEKV